jgi:glutamine cyclotransferase
MQEATREGIQMPLGRPTPGAQDPSGRSETGKVLRTIQSNRFVTGVTWVDGELWHGTWENDESDLRRIDPQTGELLETIEMPQGVAVSGLESDGRDRFFCGGGNSGKVRAVRRPNSAAAATGRSGAK